MKKQQNHKSQQLRSRAEQILRQIDTTTQNYSTVDIQRLIHELNVYQVELEMQNEELIQSRAEIEESRNSYMMLYEDAPVGYLTINDKSEILQLNIACSQLLGYSKMMLTGNRFISFISPRYVDEFYSLIHNLQEGDAKQGCELRLLNKKGESLYVCLEARPVSGSGDGTPQFLIALTNITRQKMAEEAIVLANRFRTIIESMPGLYLFLSPDLTVLEVSNAYLEATFTEREHILGRHITDVFPQCLHTGHTPAGLNLQHSLNQTLKTRQSHSIPVQRYSIPHPVNGFEERYWSIVNSPVFDEHTGQIQHIIQNITDVTRQQRAEIEVINNRERFEMFAQTTNDLLREWNVPNNRLWWNHNLQTQYGYPTSAIEPGLESWYNRIHPDEREGVESDFQKCLDERKEEWVSEYRFRRADGTYAFVLDRAFAQYNAEGEPYRLIGSMVDITERKQIESTIRESAERVRLLLEAIPNLARTSKPDGSTNYYNSKWYSYTGAGPEKLDEWGWKKFVHPEDIENTSLKWMESIASGKPLELSQRIKRGSDNMYRWHLVRASPIKDSYQQIIMWVATATDIHDQKMAAQVLERKVDERTAQLSEAVGHLQREVEDRIKIEKQLRESQHFVSKIADTMPDLLYVFDIQTEEIVYANQNLFRQLGYLDIDHTQADMKELKQLFVDQIIHPADRASFLNFTHKFKKVKDGQIVESQYRLRHKNGTWRWYHSRDVIFIRDNENNPQQVLGVVQDITQRRHLEAERTRLRLNQQKELLNAILEAQEGERKRIAESLHNGVGQILYAAKLNVEQINNKSSADNSILQIKKNINALLEEAIRETRTISYDLVPSILQDFGLKAAIQDLQTKFPEQIIRIKSNISGFDRKLEKYLEIAIFRICQELINNIIKHAAATEASLQLSQTSRELSIRVADNGKGFNVEKASTSKGIGLKSIRDRVRLLNGSIETLSEIGKGTEVTIKIPLPDKKPRKQI